MRVVFMGTPDFSVGTLQAILDAGHEIVGVVTQPDKPKGRGKSVQMTPVKELAVQHELPVYQPIKVRDPEFVEVLKTLEPEVIVVVAFGQIIPKSILDIPRYGCINVHASLLPKYRGAAPIQWAVLNGEKESGVTIMYMDTGLDTGDMLSKVIVPLEQEETAGSLFEKLSTAGAKALVDILPQLESGSVQPEKQPQESPNDYARMISKADGKLDFTRPAEELERWVRGMSPWPSAFTSLHGKTLKVWKTTVQDRKTEMGPGTVVGADRTGIYVQTGDGVLCIEELQLEGKKRMTADAFLRGCHVEEGTVLG